MWKFLSRGLRETFERGINISRNNERVKKEVHTKSQCCWKYVPVAIRNCNSYSCSRSSNQKEGTNESRERTSPHNYCDDWFGAFSYSSAIVLGWVLSQPYYRWRKWWDFKNKRKPTVGIPLVPLIVRIAISQPVNPLPSSSCVTVCNDTVENSITFGPKTADEVLEEAAEELRSVHYSMLGEVENKRGVDCIEKGENYRAIMFFRSANDHGYPAAAYNLAQCYERGLGTQQDFSKAVKWYKTASERGHPTAMYNLGVFYAHGWGGLESNKDKARELFVEAASRGQPDARSALGMDTPPTSPPSIMEEDKWSFDLNSEKNFIQNLSNNPEELYNLGMSYENSFEGHFSDPSLILQMYQFASELGHVEAKSRLNVLKTYDAIGLLTEFLLQKKKPVISFNGKSIEGARSVP